MELRKEGDKDFRTPANRQELGDPLRYLLDLSGKRLAPPELDVDSIKAVVNISAGGFAKYEIQYGLSSVSLAGVNLATTTIVSPIGTLGLQIVNNKPRSLNDISGKTVGPAIDWETRLQTVEALLTLDAAGVTAALGKFVDVYFFIDPIVGVLGNSVNISFWKRLFSITAGTQQYRINLLHGWSAGNAGNDGTANMLNPWNAWVPARQRLSMQFSLNDGSNFPANTTQAVSSMGVLVPMGVQLPV